MGSRQTEAVGLILENKVGMGRGNSLPPKEKHRNNTTLCRYFITFAPDNG